MTWQRREDGDQGGTVDTARYGYSPWGDGQAVCSGLGATSVRGLARELGRDVKRVHEDVAVLIEVGLIEKTDSGKIHVPYAVIETDFALKAA